jgi:hypothetical protein
MRAEMTPNVVWERHDAHCMRFQAFELSLVRVVQNGD